MLAQVLHQVHGGGILAVIMHHRRCDCRTSRGVKDEIRTRAKILHKILQV